jgi:ABC-type transport system involved in multi-copper enzyme maturation permease subunit
MKAQLSSEVRKLLSTRTVYWFVLGAMSLCVMAVLSVSGQPASEVAKPLHEQQFYFLSTFVKLLVVVVGVRIVTDEYRFGTVMPTFTFSPRRGTVVAAKVIVGAAAGIAIALIAQATLLLTAFGLFAMNGNELVIGADGIRSLAGGVLAGGLWAAIGVGVGAIIRNQVAAIVGVFVWLMALEEMIRPRLGDLAHYLPGQAGFGLALAFTTKIALFGAAVMLGWALIGTVGGLVVTRRRDVA